MSNVKKASTEFEVLIMGKDQSGLAIEQVKENMEKLKPPVEQIRNCFKSLEDTIRNAMEQSVSQIKTMNAQLNDKAGITGINQTLGAVNKMGSAFQSVTGYNSKLVSGVQQSIVAFAALSKGLPGVINSIKALGAAVKSGSGMIGLAVSAILLIVTALRHFAEAEREAAEAARERTRAVLKQAEAEKEGLDVIGKLDAAIRNTTVGTQENTDAKEKYKSAVLSLIEIYPGLQQHLVDEEGNVRTLAEAYRLFNAQRIADLEEEKAKAQEAADKAKAALDKRLEHDAERTFSAINHYGAVKKAITGWFMPSVQELTEESEKANKSLQDVAKVLHALKFGSEDRKPNSAPKPRTENWERELRKQTEAEAKFWEDKGQFYTQDLSTQLAYWQKVKEGNKLTADERKSIDDKLLSIEQSMRKERLDATLAELKEEEAALGGSLQAQLAIRQKMQAKFIEGSKEWMAHQSQIAALQRQIDKESEESYKRIVSAKHAHGKDMALLDLEAQRNLLDHQVAMGQLSAEERIKAEENLIARKYDLEIEYLEFQKANAAGDLEATEKLNDQIAMLMEQRKQAMLQNTRELAVEQGAIWRELGDGIKSSVF